MVFTIFDRKEIRKIAEKHGVRSTGETPGQNDELDAFRHAYTSAVITMFSGKTAAELGGNLFENAEDSFSNQNPAISAMDRSNNQYGRAVGQLTTSPKEAAKLIAKGIKAGHLQTRPHYPDPFEGKEVPIPSTKPTPPTRPIVTNDSGLFSTIKTSLSNLFSPITEFFGGEVAGGRNHLIADDAGVRFEGPYIPVDMQAVMADLATRRSPSARQVQRVMKDLWRLASRRQQTPPFLPGGMGGGGFSTPPFVPAGGVGSFGASGSIGNLAGHAVSHVAGGVLSDLFTRTKTREYETERSQDALAQFRHSRGQMQAQAAQQLARGQRNL